MKKTLLILSLLLVAICVNASIVEVPENRCDAEDFLIAPCDHGHASWSAVNNEEYMKDLYDAGFNASPFLNFPDLKYAKKYNLKARMYTFEFIDNNIKDPKEQAKNWAQKLKKALPKDIYDNIYQVYLQDEPTIKTKDSLQAYANACRDIVGLRPYINLLPNDVSADYLGFKDYKEYADTFTKDLKMDFISYDSYAFFIDEGFRQDKFYSNLEEIREVALKNNVPFHNIILCSAHFNYEDPCDYSIKVQGWSTLAYGGKGLVYFSVIQPPIGNYKMAPYTGFGDKTQVWYSIKEMNYSIHNIMPYYKDLTNVNVYHIGNIPKLARGPETAKVIDSIEVETFDNNNDLLIGEFVGKDNKYYAIVVNKNRKYSAKINNIKFKKGSKVMHISEYTNPFKWNEDKQVDTLNGEDLWIKSGHGILLRAD